MTSADPLPPSIPRHMPAGFTLVELVAVVLLLSIISVFAVSRFDSLSGWRSQYGFRTFLNTWEFTFREAQTRREAYRLVIDLDRQTYAVLREIPQTGTAARQVDYLQNLRTRGERERREQEREREMLSLDEEFKREDERQSESLEALFYEFAYSDPNGSVRLTRPLDFPQLADPKALPEGIEIRDVKVGAETYEKGEVAIRFSPLGASDFALVHLRADDQIYSALLNPSTGELEIKSGDLDFEWTFSKKGRNT